MSRYRRIFPSCNSCRNGAVSGLFVCVCLSRKGKRDGRAHYSLVPSLLGLRCSTEHSFEAMVDLDGHLCFGSLLVSHNKWGRV